MRSSSMRNVCYWHVCLLAWISCAAAFCSPQHSFVKTTARHALPDSATDLFFSTSSSLLTAATEPWVQPTADFLGPFLNFLSFAMLARVVLSWYPNTKVSDFPWILVGLPTEPLLRAIKGVVPPAFGVDITPIVWLGFFTFVNEILLGQQGLLTMKLKYGI